MAKVNSRKRPVKKNIKKRSVKKKPVQRNISRIKKNEAFLRLVHNTNSKQRKELIRTASKDQILSVCECAFNILRKNVGLSPPQVTQLRKAKKIVYLIVDPKVSVAKKKKILEQSGGFLPLLLAPILGSVLGGIAEHLIKK